METLDFCYSCRNQRLFHQNEMIDFLLRFLYIKTNKKILIIAYRLVPNIINLIIPSYREKFNSVISNIICSKYLDPFEYIFNMYFYNTHPINNYKQCDYCLEYYCPLHVKIAPHKIVRNNNKVKEICNWCYYDYYY